MKKWHIAVVVLVVIAVGVGALFAGRAWAESESSGTQDQRPFAGDGNGPPNTGDGSMPGNGRFGGNMVSGSIISVDSSGITVQTEDGSTKIVLIGASTGISLVTEGGATDLSTGAKVVVTGTTNDDGTVTAASIRLGDIDALGAMPDGFQPPDGASTTTE